jgi:hypothetical protein
VIHAEEVEGSMEHEDFDFLFEGVAEFGGLLFSAIDGDGEIAEGKTAEGRTAPSRSRLGRVRGGTLPIGRAGMLW